MRKIDIFNHIQPHKYFEHIQGIASAKVGLGKRTSGHTRLRDLDERFRVMDRFGDYRQVLTIPGPQPADLGGPSESPDIARIGNDGLAELVQRHPDRFVGFAAAIPMNNPEAAADETHRAIRELGACGVEIFTNVNGKPLDAPEFRPFWDAVAQHDLPVWMHPARKLTDYPSEPRSRYEISHVLGYPYETSVAMARLVFSGMLDLYPGLKIITHHMGGILPYVEGRIGPGWGALGSRTSEEDYSGVLASLKRPHADYFKEFYADTALLGARAGTVCGLDYFGADHVLFASDFPFDPEPGKFILDTIAIIDGLDISNEVRAKIYHGNAERLLKLSSGD